jgi:hypothetical protein
MKVDDLQIVTTATGEAEDATLTALDCVTAARQAGLMTRRTREIALTHSKSADVKTVARMMIDPHTAAGGTPAAPRGRRHPAAAAGNARRFPPLPGQRWSKPMAMPTKGPLQAGARNDAIKLCENRAKTVQMSQVKDFAITTVPNMLAHGTKAEQISGAAKGSSPSS